jgi:hypothetical protein
MSALAGLIRKELFHIRRDRRTGGRWRSSS